MKIVDTVLLYAPEKSSKALRMKPAIIRMGARIKMVTPEMFQMKIGELLGFTESEIAEIAATAQVSDEEAGHNSQLSEEEVKELAKLQEEVLVMWNFEGTKIDTLLRNFKKAGVSKVNLKAVVTPNNIKWTFAQLVHELGKEHEAYQQMEEVK